ncbi:uncharacterized protein IUM83_01096 [Phytophthora cinnamomi]|uniref:uncharacterized protein n=1 Tax=Phytophthora cinnamomi TaxID=4785 RepID=UPI00355A98E0|nr:hypothetical protein IUM83_01096 [Phytophthora cinnamomi]
MQVLVVQETMKRDEQNKRLSKTKKAAFAAADPNNVSAVSETASGETGVISLATAHMRRIYGRLSELLLVNCSHKTNRYNYQLLTFMTMNEFGEGVVVQQSLLETNGDWHMERAVGHFKSLHPTQIDRLRVIVVDKDLNEIKVLQSKLSDLPLPRYQIPQEKALSTLPHFKNHTNNRLENFFGKLKHAVDGSMSMAGCVKATTGGCKTNRRTVYESAFNTDRYKFTVSGGDQTLVVVQGASKTHRLRVDTWECDCEYAFTMILPCLHAIAYRKKESIPGPVVPWMQIDQRWTNTSRQLRRVKQFSYETFEKGFKKAEKRSQAQRYREAVRATHLTCSEMADIEDDVEFDAMLELLAQWRNVRQRKMSSGSGAAEASRGKKAALKQEVTDEDVKGEFDLSCSDSDYLTDDSEYEDDASTRGDHEHEVATSARPKIVFNPKMKKVGAPRKYRKPSLKDTQRRLSGVLVKYGDAESKKPKFKLMKNPVTVQDPFYILPEKLPLRA